MLARYQQHQWGRSGVRPRAGGGEKGLAWHSAGRKEIKPNSWRDLIACAEYLIDNKYASAHKLGVQGGAAPGALPLDEPSPSVRSCSARPCWSTLSLILLAWTKPLMRWCKRTSLAPRLTQQIFSTCTRWILIFTYRRIRSIRPCYLRPEKRIPAFGLGNRPNWSLA